MKWLHLTDLHITPKYESAQRDAMREMMKCLRSTLAGGRVDAVFITGDVAYTGQRADYELAREILIEPLRQIEALRDVPFYCCPGNHDIDCERVHPFKLTDLPRSKQDRFWFDDEVSRRNRAPRVVAFEEFSSFVSSNRIHSVEIEHRVAQAHMLDAANEQVAVVCCNTALLSHMDLDEERKVQAPTPALRGVLGRLNERPSKTPIFVLSHHPISWFMPSDVEPLRALLKNDGAVYLHGHIHLVRPDYTSGGLLGFGFSAAYQDHLDAQGDFYKNGFAVCETVDDHLHFVVMKWDAETGQWVRETSIPSGISEGSPRIPGGYHVQLHHSGTRRAGMPSIAGRPQRTPPDASGVKPIEAIEGDAWARVLERAGVVPSSSNIQLLSSDSAVADFRGQFDGQTWLIRCIGGPGHIVSRGQVVDLNTDMDLEAVEAAILFTVGGIADDARTTYLKFRTKKNLTVLTGSDAASKLLAASPGLRDLLSRLDAAEVEVELALTSSSVFALVRDRVRGAWFWVADERGQQLPPSDSVVGKVRDTFASVQAATYAQTAAQIPLIAKAAGPQFDRSLYLKEAQALHNKIHYAGLATNAARLQNVPLTGVYVAAKADLEAGFGSTTGIAGAIDDMLQSLEIEPRIREQLRVQLYRSYGLTQNRETFAAQAVYQRFGCIVVLGDPGSGKTCFTKHQILQYCAEKPLSWYARHLPVYIPLAEAARGMAAGKPLPEIVAELSALRGLTLNAQDVERLGQAGELAFFFDGLDEVDRIEHRAAVADCIRDQIQQLRPRGNRFVLTSRPAAVQFVDLPDELRVLTLRGLSDAEIALLAQRVLVAQRAVSSEGVAALKDIDIDSLRPTGEEQQVVTQLIEDCRSTASIHRLAQNPLLLTLLVTIYANSGRPSAKRHRVYTQAVQTLVYVRSRKANQRPMAESDLRLRLGSIALRQFESSEGTVLSKAQVVECLRQAMERQLGHPVDRGEAESFAQDVAETTGLLVIHDGPSVSAPAVTFMHQSFFEYYAAVGLLAVDPLARLPTLIHEPRWREVLLLLAGMTADRDDVTPLVERILQDRNRVASVTLENLLLAFDCALESEVPPERAQRALFNCIREAVDQGPLRHDFALREDVGERLGRLASLTRSRMLVDFLCDGLRSQDDSTKAAFVEFLGFVGSEGELDGKILEVYEMCAESSSQDVRLAVLSSAAKAEVLRSDWVLNVVRDCLSGNVAQKNAAANALESAPGLANGEQEWALLRQLLDDPNAVVAGAAASALVRGGIYLVPASDDGRRTLLSILRRLEDEQAAQYRERVTISFSTAEIEGLLASRLSDERQIALRLIPWLRNAEEYAYSRLMGVVRDGVDPEEVVAALGALRVSEGAHSLLRMADVDLVLGLLRSSPRAKSLERRDVRIAAVRLLSKVGSSDVVARGLVDYLRRYRQTGEYLHALRALKSLTNPLNYLTDYFVETLDAILPAVGDKPYPKFDRETSDLLEELLGAFAEQTEVVNPVRARRYLRAAVDHRVPQDVRRALIRAAAACTEPEEGLIAQWREILRHPPEGLGDAVALGVEEITRHSRRRLDFVRAIYPHLDHIRDDLLAAYARNWRATGAALYGMRFVHFRRALAAVEFTSRSYREMAARARDELE